MEDPKPTFAYLVNQISDKFPDLAYLHLVEPRVEGNKDRPVGAGEVCSIVFVFQVSTH